MLLLFFMTGYMNHPHPRLFTKPVTLRSIKTVKFGSLNLHLVKESNTFGSHYVSVRHPETLMNWNLETKVTRQKVPSSACLWILDLKCIPTGLLAVADCAKDGVQPRRRHSRHDPCKDRQTADRAKQDYFIFIWIRYISDTRQVRVFYTKAQDALKTKSKSKTLRELQKTNVRATQYNSNSKWK